MTRALALSVAITVAASLPVPGQQPATNSMPEVTSTSALGTLQEEQPVDVTGRPEWSSHRRFPTTRVYVQQAPGEVGLEQLCAIAIFAMARHKPGSRRRSKLAYRIAFNSICMRPGPWTNTGGPTRMKCRSNCATLLQRQIHCSGRGSARPVPAHDLSARRF
jgi:hypothetical protein